MSLDTSMPSVGSTASDITNYRYKGGFPDAFLDYASTQMPRSVYDSMRWAEYLWLNYGVFRSCMRRVVRYMLTKIELMDIDDEEKEKREDFLHNEMNLMSHLASAGDNLMCYGTAYVSLTDAWTRHLKCPKCFQEWPLGKRPFTFNLQRLSFRAECNRCRYAGDMQRVDRRDPSRPPKLIHWDPKQMRPRTHMTSGVSEIFWEIPGWLKTFITTGNKFYLEHTQWDIVEAVRDNTLLRFDDDYIYKLCELPIAGVAHFGMGIPPAMANFKLAWYIALLRRSSEAFALDSIIPLRLLSPQAQQGMDPMVHSNLSEFRNKMLEMWQAHRVDPVSIQTSPFPVNYQSIGADGRQLTPSDLMTQGTDEFLNALDVPADLYRATLNLQVAPVALRLFERSHGQLLDGINGMINWLLRRMTIIRRWTPCRGRVMPVTLADDLDRKQLQVQLAAGQQISKTTAWAPFGINIREEIKRSLREEEVAAEETAKFQERMAKKQELTTIMQQGAMGQFSNAQGMPIGQPGMQQPGAPQPGMPQPGMPQPGAAGGGSGARMEDLTLMAEQEASRLLNMPYELRRPEMLKIKESDENLHALVISKMDGMRQQAKSQGGYQQLQAMVGGGGGAAPA